VILWLESAQPPTKQEITCPLDKGSGHNVQTLRNARKFLEKLYWGYLGSGGEIKRGIHDLTQVIQPDLHANRTG
jgi:hypothetical protein